MGEQSLWNFWPHGLDLTVVPQVQVSIIPQRGTYIRLSSFVLRLYCLTSKLKHSQVGAKLYYNDVYSVGNKAFLLNNILMTLQVGCYNPEPDHIRGFGGKF